MSLLVVVGGGEHASVLIEAARSSGWSVLGVVDPKPCQRTCARLGVANLGDEEAGIALARSRKDVKFVLGVGASRVSLVRLNVAARYDAENVAWATVIDARASVSPTAALRDGTVVFAGAIVHTGARAGRHAVVNTAAVIEHDVELGDFVQVAPGAVIGGGVSLGEGSYVGLGSRLRDHVKVGRGAMIGMGAVVVGDVGDGETVVGVPAKPRR